MSTIRANNIQGLDAPNPAIELPIDGTVILASGFSGDLESKGTFTASGLTVENNGTVQGSLTVDSTATFAVGASGTPAITASGDPNTGIYFPAADTIGFAEGGNEAGRFDSSGRLLIGTTDSTGTQLLKVNGSTSGSINGGAISLTQGRTAPPNGSTHGVINFGSETRPDGGAQIVGFADGAWTDGSDYNSGLYFATTANGSTSPTQQMRIDNAGNVFIGINRGDLDNSNFGTRIGVSSTGAFNPGWITSFRSANAANPVVNVGGSVGQARIMGDGDLENTNNRYGGWSDIKLKQNIQDASSQWDDIKSIQVRSYELIAQPDRRHIGVVAQEIEQICPGLVIERIQDEETGETVKTVAYSVLYMKAVKALQEAMERIETLEAKVSALEAN